MSDPKQNPNKVYIGDYLTKHLTVEPITKLRQSNKVIFGAIGFLLAILLVAWGIPKISFMLSEEYVSRGEQNTAIAQLENTFTDAGFTVSVANSDRGLNYLGAFESAMTLETADGQSYALHVYQFGSAALADSATRDVYYDGSGYSSDYGFSGSFSYTLQAASPHWYRTGNTLFWLDCSDEAVLDALSALFGEPVKG